MAKDPAVLFYTSDFLSGTSFFTDEQKGQYITLLCQQHQLYRIPKNHMISVCGSLDSPVVTKFVTDADGYYFNERMRKEAIKRANYCESRGSNKKGKFKVKSYENHMISERESHENHMENENDSSKKHSNKKKKNIKDKETDIVLSMLEFWNLHGPSKAIITVTDKRRRAIDARMKSQYFKEHWAEAIILAGRSKFLRGEAPTESHPNWKATFDWFIKNDQQCVSIMEGKYNDRPVEVIDDGFKAKEEALLKELYGSN